MLRRLAATSAALAILLPAARVETARRPGYGGTLRVEIGAVVSALDPADAVASLEEAAAKNQIDALIYDRPNDGKFAEEPGTGPFRLVEWEPGKHATLAANEDFREGRPFVDAIEIQMGRAAKDRLVDLELAKTDFAELPPEMARQASERGVRVSRSKPDELLALVFVADRGGAESARVREALALAVDRSAIVDFILQKEGEPAASLLPQWSSGTAFLFAAAANPSRAKELWAQKPGSAKLVLGYDSGDSLEQAVAERVAVNAKQAGIPMSVQGIGGGARDHSGVDARLMRLRMVSSAPRTALAGLLSALGPASGIPAVALQEIPSPEAIYNREKQVLDTRRVVPLVWLPQVYGLSARVRDWQAPSAGEGWPLADVWLDTQGEEQMKDQP